MKDHRLRPGFSRFPKIALTPRQLGWLSALPMGEGISTFLAWRWLLLLGAALLLSGCLAQRATRTTPAPQSEIKPPTLTQTPLPQADMKPTPSPTPTSTASQGSLPPNFRIIGYAPEWDTVVEEIQFQKLTHINYAFLLPRSDGSFTALEQPEKLHLLVRAAHAHQVKVLISVGGWGYDEQFETLAADPARRSVFVQGAVQFASDFNLDGIDVDWEYPDPGESSAHFLSLMQELRAALPQGMLLTAAVVSKGSLAEGIPPEVFAVVDFINIMVYDASATDHSPYSLAVDSLDYWSEQGLPAEKTVLGVPFYGRPVGIAYRRLVEADPAAAQRDLTVYEGQEIHYNGIPTLQRKTELALARTAGIMIWELAHDTTDETSLLNAIYQTAIRKTAPENP